MEKEGEATRAMIWSLKNGVTVDRCGIVKKKNGKIIKLRENSYGYKVFTAGPRERRVPVKVHCAVAFLKFGNSLFEEGQVVRHLNGHRTDNRWENIGIGTRSQNALDIPRDKRLEMAIHAASFLWKLSSKDVKNLRSERESGANYKYLCKKYKVSKSTVSYVVNKKTYRTQ